MEDTVIKAISLAALALAAAAPFAAPALAASSATFVDRSGETVGEATLTESETGVLINAQVRGLPANQWLAFHIHEKGTCDPKDEFKSAGGHYNPTDAAHGYGADKGPHAGDLPNQYVGADGTLRAEVFNHLVTLDGKNPITGKALMIHGGKDDYKSQPTGDAGNRLACAVIK